MPRARLGQVWEFHNRNHPRIFGQVGMKPCFYLVEISDFSLNHTYQNYEQPPQTSQNSDFQSYFSVSKIGQIFPKKISLKNLGLGDQLASFKGSTKKHVLYSLAQSTI